MPRAVVDPDELRRFAVLLNGMAQSVRKRKGSLNNNLSDLKAVWRDEKYRQFERLYAETMPQLEFFCKNAEQFAQYLRAKEKPLRRYQEHRY
ncbi:hypothetical protein M1M90_02260 [Thermodesulfovibrionales bacterium]|nr:hypothetical protein [Thermodesulfovibrionales bacterium]MCL0105879.1 hypothetical protein [Thermodesulfovibrionales bacterium]